MVVTRSAATSVSELLSAFRLVLLGGARQTGKTTLVRELLDLPASARISLDDPATLRRALEDPTGLLEALPRPAAIDEFQRGGQGLLLAVKQAADLDDRRGQLLLTGSANYLADRSVSSLPAWSTNHTTRAKRRGKSVLVDSGLAADLVGAGEADFAATADGRIAGALFETFVITEVCKQAGWSEHTVDLHHFRDRDGAEIDLIVADRRTGRFAGVEIKLTSSPTSRHARTLATFRDAHPDRFTVGLVLHAGQRVLPLGDRLWAVPVGTLWRDDPAP